MKTKRYPSDPTDEKWVRIAPLMPASGDAVGRAGATSARDQRGGLIDPGCSWRMPLIHFGPWQTVYGWFHELARHFLFQILDDVTWMVDSGCAGRDPRMGN